MRNLFDSLTGFNSSWNLRSGKHSRIIFKEFQNHQRVLKDWRDNSTSDQESRNIYGTWRNIRKYKQYWLNTVTTADISWGDSSCSGLNGVNPCLYYKGLKCWEEAWTVANWPRGGSGSPSFSEGNQSGPFGHEGFLMKLVMHQKVRVFSVKSQAAGTNLSATPSLGRMSPNFKLPCLNQIDVNRSYWYLRVQGVI